MVTGKSVASAEISGADSARRYVPDASGRLAQLLIAKLVFDLLFVLIVALAFFHNTFNPRLRGWVDPVRDKQVLGWVVDDSAPDVPVEIQLFIDDRFIANGTASHPRPDVVAARRSTNESCGFAFDIPRLDDGRHEARVFAMHASGASKRRTLRLIGDPVTFDITTTDTSGALNFTEETKEGKL